MRIPCAEPATTLKNKTGDWRTLKPIVGDKCIRCRQCEIFCPDSAIIVKEKAIVNYDYCKGCGICASVCPVKTIMMIKEEK